MSDTMDRGIDLSARLEVMFGKIADKLDAIRSSSAMPVAAIPNLYPIQHSSTSLANGNAVAVGIGGPAQGRRWEIQALAVGGSLISTSIAGTVDVYVLPNSPVDVVTGVVYPGSLEFLVDRATSLPNWAFYGSNDFAVQSPNRIWVVFSGQNAAQTICVGGMTLDYGIAPLPQGYTI